MLNSLHIYIHIYKIPTVPQFLILKVLPLYHCELLVLMLCSVEFIIK